MAGIKFDHVWKRFGEVSVLKDLDIDIPDQEFLVLVGPSGCGKSTALRCLAGLEEITDGNIYIGDRIVNDVPPKDRDIAMVFQSYALYPHMSVYDNMAFGLKLRKTPKTEIDKRVKEAAEMLGIGHLLDRKPKALSGGQRQRVALGRAIVRNPAVFLMDEPLSNLDAKLRVQTRGEISKLHQRLKTTFIYVTHDQTEALTFADTVVVMHDGRVVQAWRPDELFEKPAHTFVGYFIGSPGMNVIPASVAGSRAHVAGAVIELPRSYDIPSGKRIEIGVRPEFATLARAGEGVPVTVERIDDLGRSRLARLRLGDHAIAASVPDELNDIGQIAGLILQTGHVHVYADGERLDGRA
jgi:ABC-type sugar transport system ATPase subunit